MKIKKSTRLKDRFGVVRLFGLKDCFKEKRLDNRF